MKKDFKVEKEIQNWCQSVHTNLLYREHQIAELKDHLYCEIEQLQMDGLSAKEAFMTATQILGNKHDLRKEHSKNQYLFSILLSDWSQYLSPQQASKWNTVLSLCVAVTIVISTLILELTPYAFWSQPVMYTLILIWLIPYTKLSHAATAITIKEDCQMIRQQVSNVLTRK